jgi:hypothetical protein
MTKSEIRDLDLTQWLSRRDVFGLVAARCSAVEVECLRRIRAQKLYRARARNWDEFCSRELGGCRRTVDRSIRLLQEFGPTYFHLSQLTRISPATYRAIASHITADGVKLDGEVIALVPENTHKVSAAVRKLRENAEPLPPVKDREFDKILNHCGHIVYLLELRHDLLKRKQRRELAGVLCSILTAAEDRGVSPRQLRPR